MSEIVYYTEEGLEKLRKELEHLKTTERRNVARQISEARDKGDLSENAEYDAAKEAQGLLEAKIAKMESEFSKARILDESQIDVSKVLIMSKVTIKNVQKNVNPTTNFGNTSGILGNITYQIHLLIIGYPTSGIFLL